MDDSDQKFDNALFNLLEQACSVQPQQRNACKHCLKVVCKKGCKVCECRCKACICLGKMPATLTSVGFGANLCRNAPLWVLMFCCFAIEEFQLDGPTLATTNGENFQRMEDAAKAKAAAEAAAAEAAAAAKTKAAEAKVAKEKPAAKASITPVEGSTSAKEEEKQEAIKKESSMSAKEKKKKQKENAKEKEKDVRNKQNEDAEEEGTKERDQAIRLTRSRLIQLSTFVDQVVSSLSNVSVLRDVPPLLPLEYYPEKDEIIQSFQSHFGKSLQQYDAAIGDRWICWKQTNYWFVWKHCKGMIDISNGQYSVNTIHHRWFESNFKDSVLFLESGDQQKVTQKKSYKKRKFNRSGSASGSTLMKLELASDAHDDSHDDLNFGLSELEHIELKVLKRKEVMGRTAARHQAIIYCIRQLKLEQDNLWSSVNIQQMFLRNMETEAVKVAHRPYFEYLSTSPTPAPNFSSPASIETVMAIAMSLTLKSGLAVAADLFPFPAGSILASLSPPQEKIALKPYSKLSIGSGRVKCSHCNAILVAGSISKHMMRKHPEMLPKKASAARIAANEQMPKQIRRAILKVRHHNHQQQRHCCRHRHPHSLFPVAARYGRIFK